MGDFIHGCKRVQRTELRSSALQLSLSLVRCFSPAARVGLCRTKETTQRNGVVVTRGHLSTKLVAQSHHCEQHLEHVTPKKSATTWKFTKLSHGRRLQEFRSVQLRLKAACKSARLLSRSLHLDIALPSQRSPSHRIDPHLPKLFTFAN